MTRRILSLAGLVLAGVLAAVAVDTRADEGVYKVGDKVEAKLGAKSITGQPASIEELRGKVAFLNFYSLK